MCCRCYQERKRPTFLFDNISVTPGQNENVTFLIPTALFNAAGTSFTSIPQVSPTTTNAIFWKPAAGTVVNDANSFTEGKEFLGDVGDFMVFQLVAVNFNEDGSTIIGFLPQNIVILERYPPVPGLHYHESTKVLTFGPYVSLKGTDGLKSTVTVPISTDETIEIRWGLDASNVPVGPNLLLAVAGAEGASPIGGGALVTETGRYTIGTIETDASGNLIRLTPRIFSPIWPKGLSSTFSFPDNNGNTQTFQFEDGILMRHAQT